MGEKDLPAAAPTEPAAGLAAARFEDWCAMFKGWAYKEEYR